MTPPPEYRHHNDDDDDDDDDEPLRLRRLEHQVETLTSTVADLASAVEALAFASADPHAAVAVRRVNRLLHTIGAETVSGP
jgi:hypothetical protein